MDCSRAQFEAMLKFGKNTGSVEELINHVDNAGCFYFMSEVTDDYQLGYEYAVNSGLFTEELKNIGMLADYIDYVAYGCDIRLKRRFRCFVEVLRYFYIKNGVLLKYNGPGGDVVIPDSVTSIGGWAFYDCNALESIVIPDSVISIGDSSFWNCSSLKSIIIPNSVASIGNSAFGGCSSLESSVVVQGNSVYDSRTNCNTIIDTRTNTLLAGCKNTVIPDSVTSVGDRAFWGCSSLESITIPRSVVFIGIDVFYECSSQLIIYGRPGSYAEEYANSESIAFNDIVDKPITPPSEAPTTTPLSISAGDVNNDGRIDLTDAKLILKAAVHIISLPKEDEVGYDVNGDGHITLHDAQLILKAALHIIEL